MSGRNKRNQANDLEGSHPQELNTQHRHFLVRSLSRNDTELAALIKVNASLAKIKEQLLIIMKNYLKTLVNRFNVIFKFFHFDRIENI